MDLEKFRDDVYNITEKLALKLNQENIPKITYVRERLIEMYQKNALLFLRGLKNYIDDDVESCTLIKIDASNGENPGPENTDTFIFKIVTKDTLLHYVVTSIMKNQIIYRLADNKEIAYIEYGTIPDKTTLPGVSE